MFDEVTRKGTRWRVFWPDVGDLAGAREAITIGYIACFVLAGISLLAAAFGPRENLVGVLMFGMLGWLLRRKSRTAAVIASGMIGLSMIVSVINTGTPFVGVVTLIVFACLLSGVRGTFAYWKLTDAGRRAAPPGANVLQ
jgi:hypothetical protein